MHRHPPSNGLGANTSIQDAFNLAWKIAFAVRGTGGQPLLDSYSAERVPVGRQIVTRANQSRRDFAGLREWFPQDSDDPVDAGLRKLKDAGPEGVRLREELYQALKTKDYEFNAHGVELNHRYLSSAVVTDPEAGVEEWTSDPELSAQPTTRPGAKLPHSWLVNHKGRRISTLDVVGKGKFTLITGLAGTAWSEAAEKMDAAWLRTVVIGAPGTEDPYGEWWARREIEEAGALLIRPDGYVAWRHVRAVWDLETAFEELTAAVGAVLGGNGS